MQPRRGRQHALSDFENGDIYNLVEEEFRAWHAGLSQWRGIPDVNSRSIGIEIVNPGHEFGYVPFTAEQIQSVIDLCRDIMTRHHIPAGNILGHSDVAPARKSDPGELFPWKMLAENHIGLWTDAFAVPRQSVGEMLDAIGYDTADELSALTAFQRHFYPEALLDKGEKQSNAWPPYPDCIRKKDRQNEPLSTDFQRH